MFDWFGPKIRSPEASKNQRVDLTPPWYSRYLRKPGIDRVKRGCVHNPANITHTYFAAMLAPRVAALKVALAQNVKTVKLGQRDRAC